MKKIALCLLLICVASGGCFYAESGSYDERQPLAAAAVLASVENDMQVFIADDFDAYFSYMDPLEHSSLLEGYYGEYGGVGITMAFPKESDYPQVILVNQQSPAFEAGISFGEYIKEVDGSSVAGLTSTEVAAKIKGQSGTEVALTIIGADSSERTVTLIRRLIETFSVEERLIADYPQFAYISVSSFAENTPTEFQAIWQKITAQRKIEGLILDLRNNGGGSFPASLSLAGYFVPKGNTLVWQKTRNGMIEDKSSGGDINVPTVILQNGNSASASEVFFGALLDNGCAVSVGTTSYGKGITQTIITLPSNMGFRYTASMYFTPSMFKLHGIGITPTYEVELNENCDIYDIYKGNAEKDNQLAKALELLLAK